jgi:hypothetical protein
LPEELCGSPFTVADARRLGLARWRLRQPHLHSPTRAVRAAEPATSTLQRATAYAVALPEDAAFSHLTAARLWGLDLPLPDAPGEDLHVMRPSGSARTRRHGCRGHRGLEARAVVDLSGLRVTGLADTWLDLAELTVPAFGLDDLVVVADQVASRLIGPPEPGTGSLDRDAGRRAIAGALGARVRPRGARLLRRALDLSRAPVRSPMETRARLMFVRAGLPEPEVNAAVHGRDGQWLLEGDLVWRGQRVVGEYQGSDHASITRRSYDAHRVAVAADEGWQVLEIYADDVYRPAQRADCLRRFARALGLG